MNLKHCLRFAAAVAVFAVAVGAHASTFTWTGGGGANDNWSLGANWGGTAPGSADTAQFNNTDLGNTNVVDTSRSIAGVLYINNSTTLQHLTDLSGNTLTDTGKLSVAVDTPGTVSATIQNGTLLVGSSSLRTDWMIGARPNLGFTNTGSSTLSNVTGTAYLNQLAAGYNPIFNNQTTNVGTLNISGGSSVTVDAATSVVIGVGFNTQGTITVGSGSTFNVTTPALRIGSSDFSFGATLGNGTLDLSAANASTLTATTVQVGSPSVGVGVTGTLKLGSSSLTATNMDVGETSGSTGTVTSGSGSTIQIQSGGYLAMAKSASGNAQMTIGSGGTLSFGSGTSARADFTVAAQPILSTNTATATVNGALSGFVGTLAVSNNTSNDNRGSISGTLDNSSGTTNLNVTSMTIATGFNSIGTAKFGAGTLTAGSVQVGDSNVIIGFNAGTTKGILGLNNTVANVTNQITVKDRGEVLTTVLGTSSGLNMTSSASSALVVNNSFVASAGGVQITFSQDPAAMLRTAATAGSIFYGLKWSGNHVTDLTALWRGADNIQGNADDKLRWDSTTFLTGTFNNAVSIFYDPAAGPGLHTDATYVGFYIMVPEPSSVLLLGLGSVLACRRRRR